MPPPTNTNDENKVPFNDFSSSLFTSAFLTLVVVIKNHPPLK